MKRVEEGAVSLSYRKPTTGSKGPAKAGAKARPGASEAKPIKARKGEKVAVVLSSLGRVAQGDLNGVEQILCLDAQDGRTLWSVQPGPVAQALAARVATELQQLDKNRDGKVDEFEALSRFGWSWNQRITSITPRYGWWAANNASWPHR